VTISTNTTIKFDGTLQQRSSTGFSFVVPTNKVFIGNVSAKATFVAGGGSQQASGLVQVKQTNAGGIIICSAPTPALSVTSANSYPTSANTGQIHLTAGTYFVDFASYNLTVDDLSVCGSLFANTPS